MQEAFGETLGNPSGAPSVDQSPDFYANLQTRFVGKFEDKGGRFDRISCALCFELGNTFPMTKSVLQN